MNDHRIIKSSKTKAEIRKEIACEVDQFLKSGGKVKNIPKGVSGNDDNVNLFAHSTNFEPKKERTPVSEIVNELEARKKAKHPLPKVRHGPRKKLITDDFGEPIRWVWEEK